MGGCLWVGNKHFASVGAWSCHDCRRTRHPDNKHVIRNRLTVINRYITKKVCPLSKTFPLVLLYAFETTSTIRATSGTKHHVHGLSQTSVALRHRVARSTVVAEEWVVNPNPKIGNWVNHDARQRKLDRCNLILTDPGYVKGCGCVTLVALHVKSSWNQHHTHGCRGGSGSSANTSTRWLEMPKSRRNSYSLSENLSNNVGGVPRLPPGRISWSADVRKVECQETVLEVATVGLFPSKIWRGSWNSASKRMNQVLRLIHQAFVAKLNKLLLELRLPLGVSTGTGNLLRKTTHLLEVHLALEVGLEVLGRRQKIGVDGHV